MKKQCGGNTQRKALSRRQKLRANAILLEEHHDFVAKMRSKLLESKPSSNSWWSKARRLTDRKQRVSNIPALKRGTEWILEAEEKTNCFVGAFEATNSMTDEEANEYSDIACVHPIFFCGLPTVEAVEKALASLDEDSANGPDLVPTRILKRCARVLALALHLLILAILKF